MCRASFRNKFEMALERECLLADQSICDGLSEMHRPCTCVFVCVYAFCLMSVFVYLELSLLQGVEFPPSRHL